MGVFLLELNKPKMLLAKMDYDAGKLDRIKFFRMVRDGAKLEAMAKEMLGRYTSVSVQALKNMLHQASNSESPRVQEDK